jgi:tRNA(adenine34) deaminase
MTIFEMNDEYFMKEALKEARMAMERDEVPIGAVVVCNQHIIARSYNLTETLNDTTAHAEMQVITAASNHLGAKYLNECTLYVTLEPCPMCAGAAFWSQIGKIVYGADDDKRGYHLTNAGMFHPKTEIVGGILKEECAAVLKEFFKKKRKS